MVVQATGPQQPQQVLWNPRKQDVDGDNVAVMVEDVRLAVPLLCTTGHHLLDEKPTLKHDIFDYQETQQAQKYRDNIESLKIYIGRKHTKFTAELVSSLDTLTLDILDELAILTEASPTPGALKKWEFDYKKREEQ